MKNINEIRKKRSIVTMDPMLDRMVNDSKVDNVMVKDYITTITILESIADAIFILNKDGRIEYANQNAINLLHIELSSLVGKLIDEIIVDTENVFTQISGKHNFQSNTDRAPFPNLTKGVFGGIEAALVYNGAFVPVFLDFSVVNNQMGEVKYIIVTAKDISYRKTLEKELKQQQALSISRDRLKALGELSVGLVHELSQPLATLKLKVELTDSLLHKDRVSDQDLENSLGEMLELINRMSNVIQNMRTHAHQTNDDTIAIVDVNCAIANACGLITYDVKKRGINLTIKKDSHLPYVVANPLLIEQVLLNLLTNARDAFDEMESAAPPVARKTKNIRIVSRTCNDKWVEISVKDNAGGMDENVKKKIFEPFFTTKEPGSNSGLGLSISKNIITSLGGDLKVNSTKNKGTELRLRIPVSQVEERTQLVNLIELLHED